MRGGKLIRYTLPLKAAEIDANGVGNEMAKTKN